MVKPVACLIACCKTKSNYPAKAINLYQSALFKKSVAYADKFGLPVYILSAKYGLISGERTIAPYNLTLNDFNKNDLNLWGKRVGIDIVNTFNNKTLVCLAGENYLIFRSHCQNKILLPLDKLSIGRRLQALNRII